MDGWSQESMQEVLGRTELFQPVEREDVAHLVRCGAVRTFAPGSVIAQEGEPATSLYVIASGSVAVRIGGAQDQPVSVLGTGDFFGEIALITGANRTATITAETAATLLELPGQEILSLAGRCLPFRVLLGKIGTSRSHGSLASRLTRSAQSARPRTF